MTVEKTFRVKNFEGLFLFTTFEGNYLEFQINIL